MPELPRKPINEVVAENLAYWMAQSEELKTQAALAAAAGVAQTTVSNYLNPTQRLEGAKGKEPSPKLTELAKIADALDVGIWNLVRPLSPAERAYYQAMEEAYRTLIASDPNGFTGNTQSGELDDLPPAPAAKRPRAPMRRAKSR